MNDGAVQWLWSAFENFSNAQLYSVLRLRSEVFVVEQACAFQDLDALDQQAMHLMALQGQDLVAYARCFPPGVTFSEASIGRVAVASRLRGVGMGHQLMVEAVRALYAEWGAQRVRIGAQAHLKAFYESHGFADVGKPYVEDGIAHLEMLRELGPPSAG
jgi:ElaA protein